MRRMEPTPSARAAFSTEPRRRRGGRRPLCPGEPTAAVSVKMPASLFDRADAAAKRARMGGIPALMRAALAAYLRSMEI